MDEPAPYVLSLMGRAELRDPEGRLVPLRTRKTVLLLAMLALATEPPRRVDLAQSLWPDVEGSAAREGLRTALSTLRKALPTGAIQTDGEVVVLKTGAVEASLRDGTGHDFMPGFDHEWAIDHRLRLRSRFVQEALATARSEGSLEWAERACAADPLSAEAATLRIEMLDAAGRNHEAAVHGDAFRARSLRELGAVPETRPPPSPAPHPLVAAVEWTLGHDPEEACALLAGTQTQWLILPIETARQIHERVLAATVRATPQRRLVQASARYFAVIGGHLDAQASDAEADYRAALDAGETPVAARLSDALAYATLSRGDFTTALAWAREGVRLAETRGDLGNLGVAEMTLAIVEGHVGATEDGYRRTDVAVQRIEGHGSAIALASARCVQIGGWLAHGEIDRSAKVIESHRRWSASFGGGRADVWSLNLGALLCERIGDHEGALAAFERMREVAPDAGQAAIATADDGLTRANCRLREFDEAATALARVTLYRRRMGSVPSELERTVMRPAVRTLKERLTNEDLRAAFQRAKCEKRHAA